MGCEISGWRFLNFGSFIRGFTVFHTENIRALVFRTELISFIPYFKTTVETFCPMDLTIGKQENSINLFPREKLIVSCEGLTLKALGGGGGVHPHEVFGS